MIPLSRIIELSVVTAFYAGICYMLFDGACEFCLREERGGGGARARIGQRLLPARGARGLRFLGSGLGARSGADWACRVHGCLAEPLPWLIQGAGLA